jgi:hypothetical protein
VCTAHTFLSVLQTSLCQLHVVCGNGSSHLYLDIQGRMPEDSLNSWMPCSAFQRMMGSRSLALSSARREMWGSRLSRNVRCAHQVPDRQWRQGANLPRRAGQQPGCNPALSAHNQATGRTCSTRMPCSASIQSTSTQSRDVKMPCARSVSFRQA